MSSKVSILELPKLGRDASQLWVKNPRERATLPFAIEPWGAVLHLLPGQTYLVASLFDGSHQVEPIFIEADDELTVWPQGSRSNRVFREDGNLVWDDARPSEVYRYVTDELVVAALKRAGKPHGLLTLRDDGSLSPPLPSR